MYRLAHISDTHVCDRLRPQDLGHILKLFVMAAEKERVDVIVHAGDFFDRRSTPEERNHLADFLRSAAEVAPVFGVRGNHDTPEDLELFNWLQTKHVVRIQESPTAPGEFFAAYRADRKQPFALIGLPWFDKAHLVSGLD